MRFGITVFDARMISLSLLKVAVRYLTMGLQKSIPHANQFDKSPKSPFNLVNELDTVSLHTVNYSTSKETMICVNPRNSIRGYFLMRREI